MLHVFLMAEQGPIYESCYTKHFIFLQFRDGLCFAMKFINNDQEFYFSTNLDKFVEGIRIFYKWRCILDLETGLAVFFWMTLYWQSSCCNLLSTMMTHVYLKCICLLILFISMPWKRGVVSSVILRWKYHYHLCPFIALCILQILNCDILSNYPIRFYHLTLVLSQNLWGSFQRTIFKWKAKYLPPYQHIF